MKHYDYLIVNTSGLYGSTFACRAKKEGKVCYDLKSMDSFQTRFVGYIFEHLLDV